MRPVARCATQAKPRSGYGSQSPSTTLRQCWHWGTCTSKGMECPRTATKPACCWIPQHDGGWSEPGKGSATFRHLVANKLCLILLDYQYACRRLRGARKLGRHTVGLIH